MSGKAREKCYLWHWVLGRTAMSRGARQIVKVALAGEPWPCRLAFSRALWVQQPGARSKKGRKTAQMCTSEGDPIVSSEYTGDGEGRTWDTLVGKVPSQAERQWAPLQGYSCSFTVIKRVWMSLYMQIKIEKLVSAIKGLILWDFTAIWGCFSGRNITRSGLDLV